jgi:hypothetical protein
LLYPQPVRQQPNHRTVLRVQAEFRSHL